MVNMQEIPITTMKKCEHNGHFTGEANICPGCGVWGIEFFNAKRGMYFFIEVQR